MNANLECIYCTIKKADTLYDEFSSNPDGKLAFMKKVFKIASESRHEESAPILSSKIMRLLSNELHIYDLYESIKKDSHRTMLDISPSIAKKIAVSENPLLASLCYAMAGNFIDFGAMDNVDQQTLSRIIDQATEQSIDTKTFQDFKNELEIMHSLVYLADNAGEFVLDQLFINTMHQLYPHLDITIIVRGKPIFNDVSTADVTEIGLYSGAKIIGNGTDIPGTDLSAITPESLSIIDNSDLIISKGQGNFESLYGCDKNIYYIFLCKCDLFVKRFNMNKFQGIFANEKRMDQLIHPL